MIVLKPFKFGRMFVLTGKITHEEGMWSTHEGFLVQLSEWNRSSATVCEGKWIYWEEV